MNVKLGKRIRALRLHREMSQEKLASLAGISAKYLGEVERGEGNISVEKLSQLALAMGVELSDLVEAEHEQKHVDLVSSIIEMAPKLNEDDAKIVYRMMKIFISG